MEKNIPQSPTVEQTLMWIKNQLISLKVGDYDANKRQVEKYIQIDFDNIEGDWKLILWMKRYSSRNEIIARLISVKNIRNVSVGSLGIDIYSNSRIWADCNEELKMIKFHKNTSSEEAVDEISFGISKFLEKSYIERLSKAFNHAINLTGGASNNLF